MARQEEGKPSVRGMLLLLSPSMAAEILATHSLPTASPPKNPPLSTAPAMAWQRSSDQKQEEEMVKASKEEGQSQQNSLTIKI
ncbi:hypothetical protein DUI87_24433 [Hirundo rustica rustica]|uniref:Uncharacterized protein n=1 Tax=Hirundo rustica rustica TaxID=333673 RepID=A0A3M0JJM3_HIRRU|nr:hypothetical protein DUI87_24433 [Hirundo rustica rustica]